MGALFSEITNWGNQPTYGLLMVAHRSLLRIWTWQPKMRHQWTHSLLAIFRISTDPEIGVNHTLSNTQSDSAHHSN